MIRILIVDDQKVFRESLKVLLETESDFKIVGTANDGETAIEQVKLVHPDVVLLDIEMPELDGIRATEIINQNFIGVKVILLTLHHHEHYVTKAVAAGAMGYLLKTTAPSELKEAIRSVYRGYSREQIPDSNQFEQKVFNQILPHPSPTNLNSLPNFIGDSSQKKYSSVNLKELNGNSIKQHFISNLASESIKNKQSEKQLSHPKITGQDISWRQVLGLLLLGIGLSTGIYWVRQQLREPRSALNFFQEQSILAKTEFTGKIKPVTTFKIAATVPSVVENINIQIGDLVKAGQPILTLKNLEAQKSQIQAFQQQQVAKTEQQGVIEQQNLAQDKILELQEKINYTKQDTLPLNQQMAEADLEAALVENRALKLPLRQRQDDVERAEAIYERNLSLVRSYQELYDNGAIAKTQLEQAQADLKVAQSDLKMAQKAAMMSAQLEQTQETKLKTQRQLTIKNKEQELKQLEQQLVTARLQYNLATKKLKLLQQQSAQLAKQLTVPVAIPINATKEGVVIELPVAIGEQVYTGNSLVSLAQMNTLNVEVEVNARIINAVRLGQQARVKVGVGENALEFKGKIVTINPIPSEQLNHTVKVQFHNPKSLLLVGQVASVQFLSE